jgi:sugar lactone lactonase YvrE
VKSITNAGLSQPENLVYDDVSDVYLVSNMGPGQPTARDNNGFISLVSSDGRVLSLRWIAGGVNGAVLDAPKGLAIKGDTLAVADVGAMHLFDRRTGRPIQTIAIPGIVMNDVAFTSDGSMWVTDTGPSRDKRPIDTSHDIDAVWRVTPDGHVRAVARGLGLEGPDGIVVDSSGALVATFDGNRLERIGKSTLRPITVASLPAGKIDGLRRLDDGSLVVTSWDAGTVWRRWADGRLTPLLRGVPSPAGVTVDSRHHRLAVTSMTANAMYFVPLQ